MIGLISIEPERSGTLFAHWSASSRFSHSSRQKPPICSFDSDERQQVLHRSSFAQGGASRRLTLLTIGKRENRRRSVNRAARATRSARRRSRFPTDPPAAPA